MSKRNRASVTFHLDKFWVYFLGDLFSVNQILENDVCGVVGIQPPYNDNKPEENEIVCNNWGILSLQKEMKPFNHENERTNEKKKKRFFFHFLSNAQCGWANHSKLTIPSNRIKFFLTKSFSTFFPLCVCKRNQTIGDKRMNGDGRWRADGLGCGYVWGWEEWGKSSGSGEKKKKVVKFSFWKKRSHTHQIKDRIHKWLWGRLMIFLFSKFRFVTQLTNIWWYRWSISKTIN